MKEIGAAHLGQERAKLKTVECQRLPRFAQSVRSIRVKQGREIGLVEGDVVEAPILETLLAFFDEIEEFRNKCWRCDGHLKSDLQHRPNRRIGIEKGKNLGILEILGLC